MPEFGWDKVTEEDKEKILKGMKNGKIYNFPKSIEIDWTDRCNIECLFCWQKPMLKGDEIPFETLKKIFKEMEILGVKTLQVSGGGEPLFHKDIEKILENLKEYSFQIGTLTTNGILINKKIHKKLLSLTRNQITISLNFHKASTYKEIMKTPEKNFYLILENIKGIVEEKKSIKKDKPLIILQYLINGENWIELLEMMKLAQELGVDGVAFNPLCLWNKKRELFIERKEEFLKKVKEVYEMDKNGIIWNLYTLVPEINVEIQLLREKYFKGKYPRSSVMERNFNCLQNFCIFPWFAMHIKANGNVYPCCVLLNPSFKPLGNVYKNSLKEIWEGREFEKLRKNMYIFLKEQKPKKINLFPISIFKKFKSFNLPKVCKDKGSCFLRALPYLEDTEFCLLIDELFKRKNKINVNFPGFLKDDAYALIEGEAGERKKIEIRINRVFAGLVNPDKRKFKFEFLPNPLNEGFHLIEIFDEKGNLLAEKIVEKV